MNAVQCDYCGKFAANPAASGFRENRRAALPAGWTYVAALDARDVRAADRIGEFCEDEVGEFCSRECISGHFARPKKEG